MRADGKDLPIATTTTTTTRLLLPHQVDQAARFLAENGTTTTTACQNDDDTNTIYLTLRVEPSLVLWNTLRPLLFDAPRSVSRRALSCILTECFFKNDNDDASPYGWWKKEQQHQNDQQQRSAAVVETTSNTETLDELSCTIEQRSLRVPLPSSSLLSRSSLTRKRKHNTKIVLWIQPTTTVRVEYLFASLLIRWEHRFIQAQSLAGYIATLGGGFFLCHHFSTAIFLAEQQQRLALLLNDENMYYACAINKAYSCIYNGKFDTARSILRQVRRAIAPPPAPPAVNHATTLTSQQQQHPHPVIEKMCRSALLFGKRMRRQSKLLLSSKSSDAGSASGQTNAGTTAQQPPSATVDDYLRVRVVRDKSRTDDLVIPFSKASSR